MSASSTPQGTGCMKMVSFLLYNTLRQDWQSVHGHPPPGLDCPSRGHCRCVPWLRDLEAGCCSWAEPSWEWVGFCTGGASKLTLLEGSCNLSGGCPEGGE